MKKQLSAIGYQLSALILLCSLAHADAAGVRFEATVSSESITQDQQIEVTITLDRVGLAALRVYRAPTAPDFDLLHTGSNEQTQFQMVNGRTSVRVIEQHVYIFHPKKRGALKISPAVGAHRRHRAQDARDHRARRGAARRTRCRRWARHSRSRSACR